MNKKIVGGVVAGLMLAVAPLFATAGCSSTSKAAQPYLDSKNNGADTQGAITIVDPDGFSNVSAKCVGHDGVYAAYHGDNAYGSIFVVPSDPNCATGTYVDPNVSK